MGVGPLFTMLRRPLRKVRQPVVPGEREALVALVVDAVEAHVLAAAARECRRLARGSERLRVHVASNLLRGVGMGVD